MRIKIAAVGKLKEKYLKDALNEYSKRIKAYGRFEVTEVSDGRDDDPSSMEKEAASLLARIKDSEYVVALMIEGREMGSEKFASTLEELNIRGISDITFVIGGSNGLHESVRERANMSLSFSKMTFPHQLMRVILAEQIYRAYKIINGEKYHK
jgi:23S rRNA (pseudouridine1915-N3)-methyltransferase